MGIALFFPSLSNGYSLCRKRNFRKENSLKKKCLQKQIQLEEGTVSAKVKVSAKQRRETKAQKRKERYEQRTRKIAKYDLWGGDGKGVMIQMSWLD